MKPTLSRVDAETLRQAAQNARALVTPEMFALAEKVTLDPTYITPPTTEESVVLRSGSVEYVLMNLVEKVARDDVDEMVVK